MPRLTAMDEQFVHQIPEPLPNTVVHHQFWRESLFFVMHPTDGPGDVVILTLAHFPAREEMDSLQLGRVGGAPTLGIHRRPYDGDPHTMAVGTVKIDIVEPYRTVHLHVGDGPNVPLTMDITFTARTAANGYRRGTMRAGHELIWDQSHMIQSGWYNGTFTHQGTTYTVDNWWGQRDHSWGIRDHARCPLWIWLAVQLPEGMLAVWHWEYPNGARVYTDGCFAPAGGGDPVPVIDFRHDGLHWIDEHGAPVSYGQFGDDVTGLAGHVEFVLEGGRTIGVDAEGRWAQRYDAFSNRAPDSLGGGLHEMVVHSSEGSVGTAIYEVTGQFHHRYFPIQRGERLPPDGR
jgi:hypothetical protein